MIDRLHHVAVVVKSADAALGFFRDLMGLPVVRDEVIEEQGVRGVLMALGENELELIEPVRGDTGVARYLESRGERLHHICFRTDDIRRELDRLAAQGVELIDREPRTGLAGQIGFIHPRAMHGVLVELAQLPPGTHESDDQGIEHLAALVGDYAAATGAWRDILGLTVQREVDNVAREMHVGYMKSGHCTIEILSALTPESRFWRRLERDGEGMVSMIALAVDDIAAEVARYRAAGIEVPDPTPGASGNQRVIFGNAQTFGVYIQLVQPGPGGADDE